MRSVIEEFSILSLGGVMVAIRELCSVPAGIWVGIRKQMEDNCDNLYYILWRVLQIVHEGTHKIALKSKIGSMRIE